MNPPALKFGCQTFTWEMLGDAWTGGPDDLVAAIADGGYAGIEITDTMIGSYAGRPADFARRLDDAGLALVAFAMGSDGGFTEPAQAEADLEAVRRWVEFAAHFPGALVSMGSATVMSEGPRDDKFAVAADIYNRAAEIGRAAGVDVAVHPSSHHDTLLFSREDYDRIFALLEPRGRLGARHRPYPARRTGDRRHAGGASRPHPLRASQGRGRAGNLGDAGRRRLRHSGGDRGGARRRRSSTAGSSSRRSRQAAAADPAAAVRANRETMRRLGFA